MSEIEIVGYTPGAIGKIVELHGTYYDEYWQLGSYFEAKVAEEFGELMCRFNPEQDGFWTARLDGEILGGIVIDGKAGATEGARLRFFVIDPAYQGQGIGKKLMETAMNFCRQAGFKRVYLTTFAGLDAARSLYERVGFKLIWQDEAKHWGTVLQEQKFEVWL